MNVLSKWQGWQALKQHLQSVRLQKDRQDNGQTGPHRTAWLPAAGCCWWRGHRAEHFAIIWQCHRGLSAPVSALLSPSSRNPHVGISRSESPAPARLLLLLGQAVVDNIAEFLPRVKVIGV